MDPSDKVTAYIKKHVFWSDKLTILRALFTSTELTEEVKWGAPSYSLNGKLVAGMAAFKNYCGIWFHQGVFLKDAEKKLVNAQEGKTKALRQWRFTEEEEIPKQLVSTYIEEAIANCKAGKEIKPQRKKEVPIPDLLMNLLNKDSNFSAAFERLTPGEKREYATYISEAKREATQESRLEKIIPLILQGKSLYDKYKKN